MNEERPVERETRIVEKEPRGSSVSAIALIVVALLVLISLFFVFGGSFGDEADVNVPVPDEVDVNLNGGSANQ